MTGSQTTDSAQELFSDAWLGLTVELGVLVLGGLGLVALLFALARLSDLIPMRKERRALLERVRPVLGLLILLPYVFFAAQVALRDSGRGQTLVLAVLAGALIGAAWFAIRDFFAGVVVKAGRVFTVGDQVRVGDYEGRVGSMGIRSITLETSQGDEAVVPYSALSRVTVLRTPAVEGLAMHVFQLNIPTDESLSDARQRIREGALCAHWASVVREPQVKPLGGNSYEVTVFALDPDHGPNVEASVKKALAAPRKR